jgi:hypothetical protein
MIISAAKCHPLNSAGRFVRITSPIKQTPTDFATHRVAVELGPWPCPLTTLELWLEARFGAATHQQGFLVHYLDKLLYPDLPEAVVGWAGAGVVLRSWWCTGDGLCADDTVICGQPPGGEADNRTGITRRHCVTIYVCPQSPGDLYWVPRPLARYSLFPDLTLAPPPRVTTPASSWA